MQFVYNSSPIPGSSATGFKTFATTAAPLPVDCVVYGEFFGFAPSPDGALIGAIGHTYSNTSNFTASYTLTVGIVKQSWDPTSTHIVRKQSCVHSTFVRYLLFKTNGLTRCTNPCVTRIWFHLVLYDWVFFRIFMILVQAILHYHSLRLEKSPDKRLFIYIMF